MARRETTFICQDCGAAYGRWQGKCDACGQWNTIVEESSASLQVSARAPRKGRLFALEPLAGAGHDAPRLASPVDIVGAWAGADARLLDASRAEGIN